MICDTTIRGTSSCYRLQQTVDVEVDNVSSHLVRPSRRPESTCSYANRAPERLHCRPE